MNLLSENHGPHASGPNLQLEAATEQIMLRLCSRS